MFDQQLRKTLVALLLALATVTPACAGGPGRDYKLDRESSFVSPDRQVRLEQYFKEGEDGAYIYKIWTFDRAHRHAFLVNPAEDDTNYAAGFRFSPDSQWLVRMQKLGSGSQTLLLYRRKKGQEFRPATAKPLGDLAWDYFFTTPTAKGMHRDPDIPYGLDHAFVGVVCGMEDNYAWLG